MNADNRRRVLLVDESALARRKVRMALEAHDCDVLELASPVGAARTILRHAPHVVVLDVPPSEDTSEITEVIQASRALRDTRVILLSVRAESELAELVSQYGAFTYLEKSADDSELVRVVTMAA